MPKNLRLFETDSSLGIFPECRALSFAEFEAHILWYNCYTY
ncbi:hypothetical protein LCGC14_2022990, partial [marine sediment metagenome]